MAGGTTTATATTMLRLVGANAAVGLLEAVTDAELSEDGTILRLGTPAEIAEDPEVREVYLGKNFSLN